MRPWPSVLRPSSRIWSTTLLVIIPRCQDLGILNKLLRFYCKIVKSHFLFVEMLFKILVWNLLNQYKHILFCVKLCCIRGSEFYRNRKSTASLLRFLCDIVIYFYIVSIATSTARKTEKRDSLFNNFLHLIRDQPWNDSAERRLSYKAMPAAVERFNDLISAEMGMW